MAYIETYKGQRLKISVVADKVKYDPQGRVVKMHAVIRDDHEPWLTACAYLRQKALEALAAGSSQSTVQRHAEALRSYAEFLESEGLEWNVLPEDKSLRPTYRYRGHALGRCAQSKLARSTASNHMSVLRCFYGWAMRCGALDARSHAPYRQKVVSIRYTDKIGLEKARTVISSDLAIRRPRVDAGGVEDGCMPLRLSVRDQVLRICRDNFRPEFDLAMKLGFYSGLRIGSIVGLTHKAIRKHFPSPEIPGWFAINVGPKHGIPTKGGVNYTASMPDWLLRELLAYGTSVRRAIRVKKADEENADLLFLNLSGERMNHKTFSTDMTLLRRLAASKGIRLKRFHFHDSRATFGTAFVLASLAAGHKEKYILPRLMRLMGHANAASSLHYISWVEDNKRMEEDAEVYADYFGLPKEVTP